MPSLRVCSVILAAWMLIGTAPCLSAAETVTIGLRFVVADDLGQTTEQRRQTEALINNYVLELNEIYRNSEVVLRGSIVAVDYTRIETLDALQILKNMEHEQEGFAAMFQKKEVFGANYTIAVVSRLEIRGSSSCGRAFAVNQTIEEISSPRRAFAVMNIHPVCGAQTLAHELGHLMGLNHGALVDNCLPGQGHTTAVTPYANGYGWGECDGVRQPGEFGTIMVGGYLRHVTGENRGNLPIFSNPRIQDDHCGPQGVCGDPLIGDAARALNEHAHYYAGQQEPDVRALFDIDKGLHASMDQKHYHEEFVEIEEQICPGLATGSRKDQLKFKTIRRIDLSGNLIRNLSVPQHMNLSMQQHLSPSMIETSDIIKNGAHGCFHRNLSHIGWLSGCFHWKMHTRVIE